MFKAEVIADSINESGVRVTSMECAWPRWIHSEVMTHRSLAKSSASSRAIPIQKMIANVYKDPSGPVWWGKNQSGMQAKEELRGVWLALARFLWFKTRYVAIAVAWLAWKIGLHKQIANRILEPWMWITVIITGTEWSNLFALRCHPDAQPEFQHVARMMRRAYAESVPRQLKTGEWHLPYVMTPELREHLTLDGKTDWEKLCQISVGRTAGVSYLTNGQRDADAAIALGQKVAGNGHYGALDHCAQACSGFEPHGHLVGWKPYRKTLEGEHDFGIAIAVKRVQEHQSFLGADYSGASWYVGKRPSTSWGFSTLVGDRLTATQIGMGTGSLPDFFHVILVEDASLLGRDLTVHSTTGYGIPVRVYLVPIPGLTPEESTIYTFTTRSDCYGYRRIKV